MTNRPGGLRRTLLVGVGTLTVLSLAVLIVMLVAIHALRSTDRAARETGAATISTSRVHGDLQRLETALRSWIEQPRPPQRVVLRRRIASIDAKIAVLEADLGERRDAVASSLRWELARTRTFVSTVAEPALDPAVAAAYDEARSSDMESRAEQLGVRLNSLVESQRSALRPDRERTASLARLAEIVGVAGIVLTLLIVAGCLYYMRRAVLQPLRRVAVAAAALADGDLRARVGPSGGSGEVDALARTFDQMAASLEANRGALQRQNDELEVREVELVDAVRSAREGARVLRAVLDATPDAIALLDADGEPLVDNPPMRAVRVAFGEHATAIDRHGTLVPLDVGAARQDETRDEITLLGTRRTFARYAVPVRDGRSTPIGRLLVLREVTGEREAERVKEDFFALVSHELRTPLTSILGYVELVLGEHEQQDAAGREQRHHLEIVERNAQRLLRLVGDLLFAAQVDSGSLLLDVGSVDVAALAHDAVDAARPRAEDAGIVLEARIDDVAETVGDRDRLTQVLDNLISNALKFTRADGRVEVRLDDVDGTVRLAIADTGVGVPAGEQARLFDRFFRASNATARAIPGVGLGLMIVRAIVLAHGGTVVVDSVVGEGTTFTVLLPRDALALSEPPGAAAPAVYGDGGSPAGGR